MDNKWDIFVNTGKIQDYLNYKGNENNEIPQFTSVIGSSIRGEHNNVNNDRRSSN